MYSNRSNLEIIVGVLKHNNIKNIVISPGGTNMEFVKMVQDDAFFSCYSVVDERSAMYFAIGLYLATGDIVATSCTSAQATRNYVPGLTEAFYKRVPILAITMEKHHRFIGQEYMQAPHQASLPDDCVKASFELPYISDKNDYLHSCRLVNEAFSELSNNGFGPVQLCVPWIDFPLDDVKPRDKYIKRYNAYTDWDDVDVENKKILIIAGERREYSEEEIAAIEKFCDNANAFVYVNHLSNYFGGYRVYANRLLSSITIDEFAEDYKPDIIISIGGQTGDYPLFKLLSRSILTEIEHWRIDEDGKMIDTYDKLTKVFSCPIAFFFKKICKESSSSHSFFEDWKHGFELMNKDIQVPFSNVSIAQYLHTRIPERSIIQFAILNSLRVWSLFEIPDCVKGFSTVGAFGIDGGLSTLIGQSVATENLCFMVTGDLAFFYDMNSLGIRHIGNNLRILLINNNGGIEFKLNVGPSKSLDRFIAAGNHFKNAKGWAETCGFIYMSAKTQQEFENHCDEFLAKSEQSIVMELFVSDEDEAIAYQSIVSGKTSKGIKNEVKSEIKKVLGEERINKLKKVFNG